ncbi:hypothetical protein EMIHUDRAFT_206553 [Emiliania huxleyi CCMP1516]|uniref:Uncharacterized protein n=2 Tax=Emiliania huxleyi TaxID=2903 RepID=A0A0D3JM23_EMIH1|nr:hypothetical protein EMIHUDRAFT_206553 [Emiliania huxleyi CCMP1516]EOD24558.1 hypothetical protein EMIHUDRAFT_206553 [Emiliania huxleyi CCMP1516]|eukprot:XP_005776987.1 hypothetical protein EMIHUDRAFT_206553 [Emiliania huxleyi CCMP1516]
MQQTGTRFSREAKGQQQNSFRRATAAVLTPKRACGGGDCALEVGRLSGLVEQGEKVVSELLASMRALKERNKELNERDVLRSAELKAADELGARVRALEEKNSQLGANFARMVELAATERQAAQEREAALQQQLSKKVGAEEERAREHEEALEELRINLGLERRRREKELKQQVNSAEAALEIEKRRLPSPICSLCGNKALESEGLAPLSLPADRIAEPPTPQRLSKRTLGRTAEHPALDPTPPTDTGAAVRAAVQRANARVVVRASVHQACCRLQLGVEA